MYINDSKNNFILTKPNVMGNNSKWLMHHECGIQGVLMNFGGGFHKDALKGYRLKFLEQQKAFILKHVDLRGKPKEIFEPIEQNPEMDPAQKERSHTIGNINIPLGSM